MAPRGRPRAVPTAAPEKKDTDVVMNGTATRPARSKKSATPAVNGTATAPAEKTPAARGRAKKGSAPPAEPKDAPKPATKRKIEEEVDDDDEPASEASAPKSKKPKTAIADEGPKPKGPRRIRGKKTEINPIRYTEPLKIFVFGEGSSGELGLGAHKKAKDVKRPRFNEALTNMNVVRVVTGGMHVVALTKDNKILTWGVNDNGALGRDTSGAEVLRDIDEDGSGSDSDDEDETGGLNVLEATPTAISPEYFPEDTVFVDVAAGDSCSFALTTEGAVYGWGTFRKNEGILGFGRKINTATTPVYIDGITKVTHLACGTNHVLALDKDKHVYAWGNGQQNQLGRRVTERTLIESLQPNRVGFHDSSFKRPSQRITKIFCGDYYSFAIAEDGHVWGWGANNYCETGHPEDAGNDNASVLTPRIIQSLEGKGVTGIASGSHHSVVFTTSGKAYVWGRCDGSQTGIPMKDLNDITDEEKVLKTEAGKAKILLEPTEIPGLQDIVTGAVGPEHSIVINKDGKAYAWGFSSNYQTGLGTGDDIEVPTLIDNTAVRDTKLTWAGCGGQFSMLASKKE